jgi:CheY-like chemotaxis protein
MLYKFWVLSLFLSLAKITAMKKNTSIFYTDDDIDDQILFREVIEDLDNSYVLHTQSNGDELIHKLENPPPTPSVIFLDLNMPGKNGFQVLSEMKQSQKLNGYPIIIFTTADDNRTIDETWELGANFFITKPLSYLDYKKAIQYSLSLDWKTYESKKENFVYSKYLA